MQHKVVLAGLFWIVVLAGKLPAQAQEVTLAELTKWYKEYYLATEMDSMFWNGSLTNCNAGTMPKDILRKAEMRVNFFRLTNRLPLISMDAGLSHYPQKAALMMLANDQLSHYPTPDWKCYTTEGAKGAESSCLGFSDYEDYQESAFITGFMADIGEENYFVGHRAWILYSRIKRFSYGATTGTEALYTVMDDLDAKPSKLAYVAYPWHGHVPYNLIFAKWSFTVPSGYKVSFANSTVKVLDASGKELNTRLYPHKKFLDPTLVWYMEDMFTLYEEEYSINHLTERGFIDQTITVLVNNVLVDGVLKNYQYQVKIVDLDDLEE